MKADQSSLKTETEYLWWLTRGYVDALTKGSVHIASEFKEGLELMLHSADHLTIRRAASRALYETTLIGTADVLAFKAVAAVVYVTAGSEETAVGVG